MWQETDRDKVGALTVEQVGAIFSLYQVQALQQCRTASNAGCVTARWN